MDNEASLKSQVIRLTEELAVQKEQLATLEYALRTTATDRDRIARELAYYTDVIEGNTNTTPEMAQINRLHAVAKVLLHLVNRYSHTRKHDESTVFALGAPKSGTSLMYTILRDHPKIHTVGKDTGQLSALYRKEIDINAYWTKHLLEGKQEQKTILEFDVDFYNMPNGEKLLHQHFADKNPKFLFFLRDPAQRAWSEYKMRILQPSDQKGVTFRESLSFVEALQSEPSRQKEEPAFYSEHAYTYNGRYAQLLRPYYETFGKENILTLILEEDIAGCPNAAVIKIFDFLNLLDEDALSISLKDYNNVRFRSKGSQSLVLTIQTKSGCYNSSEPLERLFNEGIIKLSIDNGNPHQLLEIDNPTINEVKDFLRAEELWKTHRESDPEVLANLFREELLDDVNELETLLGRDLSIWKNKYRAPRKTAHTGLK